MKNYKPFKGTTSKLSNGQYEAIITTSEDTHVFIKADKKKEADRLANILLKKLVDLYNVESTLY